MHWPLNESRKKCWDLQLKRAGEWSDIMNQVCAIQVINITNHQTFWHRAMSSWSPNTLDLLSLDVVTLSKSSPGQTGVLPNRALHCPGINIHRTSVNVNFNQCLSGEVGVVSLFCSKLFTGSFPALMTPVLC